MKQKGEKVDLATQEKSKGMRKVMLTGMVACLGLFMSCSTTKQSPLVQNEDSGNESEQVDPLVQEEQNRFQYFFVEGLKQKMLGNLQEAIRLFSGCLELDPNSAAVMYELALIHASNNDLTSATLLLEKAISLNEQNKWYKILLAQIYQQMRKYDQAAELYDDLGVLEPENQEYLFMKAQMLQGAGKTREALDAYREMEKNTGVNEQISLSIQQLLIEAGRTEEALAEIQKLIDAYPEEPSYYGLLADVYLNMGEKNKALENYHQILEMDPDNGYVHFSLANYYLDEGDVEKSFDHTRKGFASPAVDINTKLQLYLMVSANANDSRITNEQIGELVDILVKTHPEEPRVYMVVAEYLVRNGDAENARLEIKKALELNSSDYLIWERLLYMDNQLQDWQALYEDSEEALFLFPNQPEVYFLHGIACLQQEKYKEVLTICDEAMAIAVDNPQLEGQIVMLQGEAHYNLGNTEEAFALFDKALELDPGNYIVMNNYAYYLSLSGENLDKAERMSGTVIEQYPDNSTYLDTHAWVLFRKKNYKLAKFYMESAIKNGGEDNPVLLEHYGDILFMLDKKQEAREYWQKAKDKGSESTILDKKIRDLKYYENEEL
jgi:tetratricopeptide (TPR) repeat protein